MPITKSAQKALRQQITRTRANRVIKSKVKSSIDAFTVSAKPENLSQAYSQIDKAVKKNQLHQNKAARLKSTLSRRLVQPQTVSKTTKKSSSSSVPKS